MTRCRFQTKSIPVIMDKYTVPIYEKRFIHRLALCICYEPVIFVNPGIQRKVAKMRSTGCILPLSADGISSIRRFHRLSIHLPAPSEAYFPFVEHRFSYMG